MSFACEDIKELHTLDSHLTHENMLKIFSIKCFKQNNVKIHFLNVFLIQHCLDFLNVILSPVESIIKEVPALSVKITI